MITGEYLRTKCPKPTELEQGMAQSCALLSRKEGKKVLQGQSGLVLPRTPGDVSATSDGCFSPWPSPQGTHRPFWGETPAHSKDPPIPPKLALHGCVSTLIRAQIISDQNKPFGKQR